MVNMGPEELRSRLLAFDRAVALRFPGRSFRLVLAGGGAMVLLGYLSRATDDLDVLTPPAELQSLMDEYDLSGRAVAYQDHFAHLHSDRETDRTDVRRPEVLSALDWDRLAEVAEDMRASTLNERRYRVFLDNYEEYKAENGRCGS